MGHKDNQDNGVNQAWQVKQDSLVGRVNEESVVHLEQQVHGDKLDHLDQLAQLDQEEKLDNVVK